MVECCVPSIVDYDDDRFFVVFLFGCCYTFFGIFMFIILMVMRICRVPQVNDAVLIYSLTFPCGALFCWMLLFVCVRYDFPCLSTFMRRIFCCGEQKQIHPANDNSIP